MADLERTIERLVDKICDGTDSPATNRRLNEFEAEKRELDRELAAAQADAPPPILLHPGIADRYASRIGDLQSLLLASSGSDSEVGERLVAAARDLVAKIVIVPSGPGSETR